jgi:hypothetical protein
LGDHLNFPVEKSWIPLAGTAFILSVNPHSLTLLSKLNCTGCESCAVEVIDRKNKDIIKSSYILSLLKVAV